MTQTNKNAPVPQARILKGESDSSSTSNKDYIILLIILIIMLFIIICLIRKPFPKYHSDKLTFLIDKRIKSSRI